VRSIARYRNSIGFSREQSLLRAPRAGCVPEEEQQHQQQQRICALRSSTMRIGKTLSVGGLIVFGTITSLFAKVGE